jgi:phosphatidylglycerophosphatase A
MVPLGSVLGTGFIPIAPATFASLATLPLVWVLARAPLAYSLTVVAVFFSGVGVATIMEKRWGRDARCITIDEMAGMLVSLFLIPFSVGTALAGFLLFRFFDIVKLPFVRRAERLPAGWGVMTDDVLAGICANLVLQFVLRAVVPAFTRA